MSRTLVAGLVGTLLGTLAASLSLAGEGAGSPSQAAQGREPAGRSGSKSAAGTPSFPSEVELVTVDVSVVDRASGAAVTGLTREDFTLAEDGAPQAVTSFEPIDVAAVGRQAAVLRSRVASNSDRIGRAGRTFVVVFDGLHLSPQGGATARQAIARFITASVREGDLLMLVATQAPTWLATRTESGRQQLLAALERQTGALASELDLDYMSPYEALRIDNERDVPTAMRVVRRWRASGYLPALWDEGENDSDRRGEGRLDPQVTARAREVRLSALSRQTTTLEVLGRVLESLTGVKGRKSVLLVSEGFVHDTQQDGYRRINRGARVANAVVYFLDARGLEGLPETLSAEWGATLSPEDSFDSGGERTLASAGAFSVALDSGGFALRSTNDLAGGMDRIARESESYYLLGYFPTRTQRDGKFRKIRVEVNRKDVEVRARRGYFAPTAAGKVKEQEGGGTSSRPFQAALDSPYELDGVPLRLASFVLASSQPERAKVVVLAEVDLRPFRFERQDDRYLDSLQTLLVVANREGGAPERKEEKVDLTLREETRARLAGRGFPLTREFDLAPGEYAAKLVVREANLGLMGSVTLEFSVPSPQGLRLSTPIVTDTLQAGAEGELPQAVMVARREFAGDATLACHYIIYGARRDSGTGRSHLTVSHAVHAPDGTLLAESKPETLEGTLDGDEVSHLLAFPLAGFDPGEYRLILRIHDDVANHILERAEPFVITAPATSPAATTAN